MLVSVSWSLDKAVQGQARRRRLQIFPKNAEAYVRRGDAYKEKGEPDRALKDYNKALEFYSAYVHGYISRGSVYTDQGEYDRAIEDLDKAIEIDPLKASAYNKRGVVYHAMGDYARAVVEFSNAIEIDPKLAVAYRNRAVTYAKRGRGHGQSKTSPKQTSSTPRSPYPTSLPSNLKRRMVLRRAPVQKSDGSEEAAKTSAVSKQLDLAFWNSIKGSDDADMLKAYLDQFPGGTFASIAKIKLKKLKTAA